MIKAIASARIDVAILWSICPETFGFSTCEAFAGGALPVTNSGSGNIARLVQESGVGFVFNTEQELFEAFDSGQIVRACRTIEGGETRMAATRRFSRMTADLAFGAARA